MTAPKPDTPEYRWWSEGALDEAEARDGDLTAGQREARDVLVGLARCHPDQPVHHLAASVTKIFCAGKPLRTRLRIAWRILR